MEKIQQYVLKDKEIFVGLEDSKRSWKLCVRSEHTVVHETSMPAEYEALRGYFRNKFPGCCITVMCESGFRGFELHDLLVADGKQCIVTPAHTVVEEKCNRKKNDRTDCRRLAKNLENGDYKRCYVPPREDRENRQVSRTCDQLQRDIVRVCNRIRRTLEFHGIDPILPKGQWGVKRYREVREIVAGLSISDIVKYSFEIAFKELEQLRMLRKEVVARLREIAKNDRYKEKVALLESSPGIGTLTAIRLVLEWGDVTRFKRKEEFASFLGLIPSDYSTGEQERLGHITKQGNRRVRAWLIECAWHAIRKDPVLLKKYNAVLSHCGGSKRAIVAVARKLGIRLRALLIKGETYQIGLVEG